MPTFSTEDKAVYQIILQAKNETQAAFAQVRAEMQGLAAQMQAQTAVAMSSMGHLATIANAHRQAAAQVRTAWQTAMSDLESSWQNVSKRVAGGVNAMNPLGLTAGQTTGVALAVGGAASIKEAADYQQSLLKVKALTEATPGDMQMWGPALVEMSKGTIESAQELAEGLFYVASSGYHGADALLLLDRIQKSAAAGMGSMKDVAYVTTTTLNAYGQSAAHATEVTDQLKKAIIEGKMEPSQLAPVLGRVTPIASALGVPLDEVLAAIASATRVGATPNVAVTGLRALLIKLAHPTKQSQEALESIGLDPAELLKEIDTAHGGPGLHAVLAEIFKASGGNTQLLIDIFGNQRAATMALGLDKSGGGSIYQHIYDEEHNHSAGSVDTAFATSMEGFNAQSKVLINNITAVGRAIGNAFLPGLTQTVHELTVGFNAVATALGFVGSVLGFVGHAIGLTIEPGRILGWVLEGVAVIMAVRGVQASLSFGQALGGLAINFARVALMAGASAAATVAAWLAAAAPFVAIAAIIVAVAATIYWAWVNNFGGIQTFVLGVFDGIKNAVAGLMDWLAEHHLFGVDSNWRKGIADMGKAVGDGVNSAKDAAGNAINGAFNGPGLPTIPSNPSGMPQDETTEETEPAKNPYENSYGLSKAQIDKIGPEGLDGLKAVAQAKLDVAAMQDQINEAQNAEADLRMDQQQREIDFALAQIDNERAMLDLKRQSADIDAAMIAPKARQRDLEQQIKDATHERLMLNFEQNDLDLQKAGFEQNADLRRIQQQIAQATEIMNSTHSASQAGAMKNAIDALKVKESGIKQALFPLDDAKLENSIGKDRQDLDNKLGAMPARKELADLMPVITALDHKKQALADTTSLLQHQMDVAKMAYDVETLAAKPAMLAAQQHILLLQQHQRELKGIYDQQVENWILEQQMSGHLTHKEATGILKKLGLKETEEGKAQEMIDELDRLHSVVTTGGTDTARGAATGDTDITAAPTADNRELDPSVREFPNGHTFQIEIHNPVVNNQDSIDKQLDILRAGVRQAAAQGVELPVGSSEQH